MTFCQNDFFFVSQFHVKYDVSRLFLDFLSKQHLFGSLFYVQFQKTVTSFKKLSRVSNNCHEFQKTVTSFKKLSRVSKNCHKFHVQFQKKLSHLTIVVVKRSVILKKKSRLQLLILTACKKTFFRVSKC